MKHLIMGTAGHIDHGKTTLIQKLTGFDCDTHKDEKKRGITIHLGFTHLKTGEDKIGIIDVPGHADFVNTMVSGAAGIDFVLLVIAADAGIMPQTSEHLNIMQILKITKGIIVLTKSDLVEPEYLELVEEEVKEFVDGSFLENAPIIKYSAVTDRGLDELSKEIQQITADIQPRTTKELFRLYIDRLFTLPGFGTIAAGTVRSGKIDKSSKLYLYPGHKPVKIRKMERYGEQVDELTAGDRGSLNITGIDFSEVERGMLITDGMVQSSRMIDAKLRLFSHDINLKVWTQCLFLHGAVQYEVRMHLLDRDTLVSGEEAIVQIHFDKPIYACYDDRFVIRNSSSDLTLGGGEIIDVRPLHHKRRTKKLVSRLKKVAEGKIEELIAAEVRKRLYVVSHKELIPIFNISEQEIMKISSEALPEDIVALNDKDTLYLTEKTRYTKVRNRIWRHLKTYHKNNPLEEYGKTFEELLGLFGKERNVVLEGFLKVVLAKLVEEKKLKQAANTWVLAEHQVKLSPQMKAHVQFAEDFLRKYQIRVPLISELKSAALERGLDTDTLFQILKLLVNRGKIYRIEDDYIHASIVDDCRIKLLKALKEEPEGYTIAQFRDLIDGNRKICLLLIGRYDTEGYTLRKGDYRIITEKGKKFIDGID